MPEVFSAREALFLGIETTRRADTGRKCSSGFDAKIKPDSFAASCVADKFTK
ncbi:MAG: hypothetical protein M0Z66_16780 [Thermaerobacter sp.]|nr:hypothetical protein [Thermaerobacter sp.]